MSEELNIVQATLMLGGIEEILQWGGVDAKEKIEALELLFEKKPRLPRVQPENLIDGEWYEIREGGERLIVRYSRSLGQFRGAYGDQPWDGEDAKSVRPVFGPLPEFELELE